MSIRMESHHKKRAFARKTVETVELRSDETPERNAREVLVTLDSSVCGTLP